MKTEELVSLFKEHSEKSLLFEYEKDVFVGANYHITEVKNVAIDTVDCGSGTNFWRETVIQLWESPQEFDKKEFMSVHKALAILNRVHGIKPMDLDAEVKFEYGNSRFHTAQLYVADTTISDHRLVISLAVNKTDCKAKVTTETPQQEEECCAPENSCC